MKTRILVAWFDFWVGIFWDRRKRRLYIFPIPMVGVVVQWPRQIAPAGTDSKGRAGARP